MHCIKSALNADCCQIHFSDTMAEEPQEICSICEKKGKQNKIQVYQINFDEAIRFCEDEECTYPLGLNQTPKAILNRPYTDIHIKQKTSGQHKSASSNSHLKSKTSSSCIQLKSKTGKNLPIGKKILSPYTPGLTKGTTQRKDVTCFTSLTVNASLDSAKRERNLQLRGKPDKNLSSASQSKGNSISKANFLYPQWQNKDALCWLDVIMCLMVHNQHMQEVGSKGDNPPGSSVLTTLIKAYNQAVILLNTRSSSRKKDSCPERSVQEVKESNVPETTVSMAIHDCCPKTEGQDKITTDLRTLTLQDDTVKTGAGFHVLNTDFLPLVNEHGSGEAPKAFSIMTEVRESLWHMLHPHLKCQKGKNDSPVFAIPLLAKHSKDLEKLLMVKYNFKFQCFCCRFQKKDVYEKVLPTFPNVASDFHMESLTFTRNCFKCKASSQPMTMEFLRLPEVLMLHFVEGLPHNRFTDYNFRHNGQQYEVSGFVQYKSNPDHFVAWIRDPKENLWMECNDLKSPLCQFKPYPPKIPSDQIHIVMWESVTTGSSKTEVLTTNVKDKICTSVPEGMDTWNVDVPPGPVTDQCSVRCLPELSNEQPYPTGDVLSNRVVTNGNSTNHKSAKVSDIDQSSLQSSQVVSPAFTVKLLASGQLVPVPFLHNSTSSKTFAEHSHGFEAPGKGLNSIERSLKGLKSSSVSPQSSSLTLLRNLKGSRSAGLLSKLPWKQNKNNDNISTANKDQGIVAQILSARKNSSQGVRSYARSRVFEGYRPKSDDSDFLKRSESRRFSSSQSECCDSRPVSPTLSTHSDSFVVQKRKKEVATEGKSIVASKRRRSQDVNMASTWSDGKSRNLQCYSRLELVNKISVGKTSLSTQKGQEVSGDKDKTSECEILQELYSALNLTLPAPKSKVQETCGPEVTSHEEPDQIPDISDLDNFVYGRNHSNSENSMDVEMDSFLSQL